MAVGGEPPSGVRATIDRAGGQGIVRVELESARRRGAADDVRAANRYDRAPGRACERHHRPADALVDGRRHVGSTLSLQKAGLYLGAVQLGNGTVLPLAPLSLPYSPEFEPRTDPQEGKKTLQEIARVTGGAERTAWDDVFSARLLRNRQVKDLVIPLTLVLLLLHVTEIGGRRLLWFAAARRWLTSLTLPRLGRRPRRQPAPAPSVGAGRAPGRSRRRPIGLAVPATIPAWLGLARRSQAEALRAEADLPRRSPH